MRFATCAILLAVLGASVLVGCGGGDSSAQEATPTTAPARIRARANANCRYLRREAATIGKGALSGNSSLLSMTTERLVKPSIPLLERVARRQQALARGTSDPAFVLYARLFEPIIVLVRQRLRTGRASERPGNAQASILSRGLENLLTELSLEQRQVARKAGLPACSIDFEHVLFSSLSG